LDGEKLNRLREAIVTAESFIASARAWLERPVAGVQDKKGGEKEVERRAVLDMCIIEDAA